MPDNAVKSKALEFFGYLDSLTHETLSNLIGVGWGNFMIELWGPGFLDAKNEAEYVCPISKF